MGTVYDCLNTSPHSLTFWLTAGHCVQDNVPSLVFLGATISEFAYNGSTNAQEIFAVNVSCIYIASLTSPNHKCIMYYSKAFDMDWVFETMFFF